LRPSTETTEAARRHFRGQDVVVEPRKMWVSGLPGKKGKIAFLGEGRAMAYADDPAWSGVLAELWRHDGEAPPEVLEAVVEVLKRWSKVWHRPMAVVAMPSRRYPRLVASVAEHVARIGRLPLVEALAVSGPPPTEDAASSVRAKDLLARTSLLPAVELHGSVLLVDDRIRTRWTVTVAGSLLAEAGASMVLPLTLHQLP
jgi:ATP-dependent DNA helicase RecQ